MKVTDLNGKQLEVTNLKEAIRQARDFKDLQHTPSIPTDGERQNYWKDLYEKLLKLKSKNLT
ncbi:3-isopropylmalate dehydratase [Chryseobacterium sp. ISL-6]|nr:3-isopropylmalate dehydratase [Chryseobacterium sp. ISL-6]